jgi:hypothetical protein
MDSNFDMGLTTRKMQEQLAHNEPPHYFEVRDTRGNRYCHCGSEKDAQRICEIYWAYDYTYVKVYPPIPETVNVQHTVMDPDLQLSEQKILPESQQQPLNL